jgi:hypothetical protein
VAWTVLVTVPPDGDFRLPLSNCQPKKTAAIITGQKTIHRMTRPPPRLDECSGRLGPAAVGTADIGTIAQDIATMLPAPSHSGHRSPKNTKVRLYPEPLQTGHFAE